MSRIRELYIRKTKIDARGPFTIADLVRFGRCKASIVPQDRFLALCELCRSRAYLIDVATELKRNLIALLDRVFPEYDWQSKTQGSRDRKVFLCLAASQILIRMLTDIWPANTCRFSARCMNAELQGERKITMSMEDSAKRLDGFLEFNGNELLMGPGKISAEQAKLYAETEFEKYRIIQDRLYESDFDQILMLEQTADGSVSKD